MVMLRAKKTSKGKQKIEIKKIENEEARYISFSKRRSGVFGKASELSTLCGAEMAILVFSPTGKLHSYGSPAVDQVVDRFLSGRPSGVSDSRCARRQQLLQELNQQFMELSRRLDASRAKKAGLRGRLEAVRGGLDGCWGGIDDFDGLGLEDLDRLRRSLWRLKTRAHAEIFTGSLAVDHGVRSSQHAGGGVPPAYSGVAQPGARFFPTPAVAAPRATAGAPVLPRSNSGMETIDFFDINGLFEGI